MPGYEPQAIELKWQQFWERNKTFRALEDTSLPKLYVLDMFPYPSGEGLHVGHPEGYTATDMYCRFQRMRGYNVLHPMGYDAFGLPAEQYAIQTGTHPRMTTERNIANIRRQIKQLGFSYDWDRELATTDVGYMRWTQWIFLVLFDTWYDPDFEWVAADGRQRRGKGRPIAELPIPEAVAAAGAEARTSLPGLVSPGVPGRVSRELVPRTRHRPRRRRGDQRTLRARRPPRAAHPAAPVDAAHHRLRRPARRRPRRADVAGADQGDAAQLGRAQRGGGGGFLRRHRRRRIRGVACGASRKRISWSALASMRSAFTRPGRTRSSAPPTWCSRPSIRWSTG